MPGFSDRAFAAFYTATSRPLWAYVYRVTGHAADTDDIVQDAFCRVLAADISALGHDAQRRYLFRVAGNLIADRWRKEQRDRSWWSRVRPGPVTAGVTDREDHDDVSQTFASLKPRERALLWLAYVEEHTHEQIAGAFGLEPASVRVLLFRARTRLRDLLKARNAQRS